MKLGSTFIVPSAPDKVLTLFLDPATMQACIPGCEELTQTDETHYRGTLVNEVAHVRFKAAFSAEITSTTAPANTSEPAVVKALLKGEDRRLGSTIKLDATLTVSPREGGQASDVRYELDMAMWGKLGRLGESVIRRRSIEVEKQFVEALTAVCSGRPVPVPADRKPARSARRAVGAEVDARTEGEPATVSPGRGSGLTETTVAPAGPSARRAEDYVILSLAAAAAFAYGVILGGRRGTRR